MATHAAEVEGNCCLEGGSSGRLKGVDNNNNNNNNNTNNTKIKNGDSRG